MMMDCPRCGFNQPKDRFCASCGLDVDQFRAKPTPLALRILRNSNFHLGLIGLLIVLAVGYIFYSRSEMLTREVGNLFGSPLSSRDSIEGEEDNSSADALPVPPVPAEIPDDTGEAAVEAELDAAAGGAKALNEPAKPAVEVQKIEVGAWEVPRETLSTLIVDAEKLNEGAEGRAYYWAQGSKIAEVLQAGARHLALNRTMPLTPGSQAIMETPATVPEGFHFGFMAELSKIEGKDFLVRWQGDLVLTGTAENAATNVTNLAGSATLGPQSVMMIVLEPTTRGVREDLLTRAGEGPWSVFASEHFRAGSTDWVILLQPK